MSDGVAELRGELHGQISALRQEFRADLDKLWKHHEVVRDRVEKIALLDDHIQRLITTLEKVDARLARVEKQQQDWRSERRIAGWLARLLWTLGGAAIAFLAQFVLTKGGPG